MMDVVFNTFDQLGLIVTTTGNVRKKRQISVPDLTTGNIQGLSQPMLVGIPLLILSAMFIASLKRKRPPEGVTIEDVPEIIVDAPPPIAHITSSIPPHLPAPGQPVGFATFFFAI